MRKCITTLLFSLIAGTCFAQDFGPLKESAWEQAALDGDTTETVRLSAQAAKYIWERDLVGSHDELTSAVQNAAISDNAKINLLIQIPKAIRIGGVEKLWTSASLELRKAIMRAAADNIEEEAIRLEERAALLRTYATRIDAGASSYTLDLGF